MSNAHTSLVLKRCYRLLSEWIRSEIREFIVWLVRITVVPGDHYGGLTVMFIDLKNENKEKWVATQKRTLANFIEIISSSEIPAGLNDSIGKTKTLIFARGLFGYSQMSSKVALLLDLPSTDDSVENVRRVLYCLVCMRQQKEAFCRECKSFQESCELAAQYGREVLSQIAPVIRKVCEIEAGGEKSCRDIDGEAGRVGP